MRKVKIIAGGYGHRVGSRNILCGKDSEIELENAEAERIVLLGVAEFSDGGVATPPESDYTDDSSDNTPDNEDTANGVETDDSDTPEYSTDMKVDELRTIGKQYGITFKIGVTKEEMVKALDEYFADSEDAPELTAEAPV